MELSARDDEYCQQLIEEVEKYADSIYMVRDNTCHSNVLAYHIGDKTGVIKPEYHIGMFQDSVLYSLYKESDNDHEGLQLDFRYFPRGYGSFDTYVWSKNITQAVIRNNLDFKIWINGKIVKPGETRVIPWDGSQIHQEREIDEDAKPLTMAEINRLLGGESIKD